MHLAILPASNPLAWTARALLATLALASAACATVLPQPLPPLPKDAPAELGGAYQGARAAYQRCGDDYVQAQAPWETYAAAGSGSVAVVSVGTAAGLMSLNDFDAGTRASITASLGTLGLVSGGLATLFGATTLRQWDRAEAYERQLKLANDRVAEAIAGNDTLALTELTRVLNEDCRVVAGSTGAPAAIGIVQDVERWRGDLRRSEAERGELASQLRQSRQSGAKAKLGRGNAEQRLRDSEDQLARRESENAGLRGELARLEEEQASLSKKQQKLLDDKRKLEATSTRYEEVAQALAQEVKQGRVALRRLRNGVIVEMPNKVLFPSGSAELNELGQQTLSAVAAAIKQLADRRVRIEGHTDNVPVGKKLDFASNWELSAARAITVTTHLQEQGVAPSIMSAEARAEYAPIASNSNPTGRARNRRIEIYLLPKPTGDREASGLDSPR